MLLDDEFFFNLCLSVSSGFCSILLFYVLEVAFTFCFIFLLHLKYILLGSKQSAGSLYICFIILKLHLVKNVG